MKFLSMSIIEVLSASTSPRLPGASPARPPQRPRRPSDKSLTSQQAAAAAAALDTNEDLTDVSRPDSAQNLRRCICPDILSSCLCGELTRTRDGVCDLCLYGIHVEGEGELFGDGYRVAGVPRPLKVSRPTPPGRGSQRERRSAEERGRLSAVLEQSEDTLRRLSAPASQRLSSRGREQDVESRSVVAAEDEHVAPGDFDEHNMI